MIGSTLEFLENIPWITLVIGVLLLLGGGHWLVEGSVLIARRLGISTLLIGLTVVAFGTSAPELSFNVMAALNDHGELSFGNVVGSNIANIALVLGLTALISPLVVNSRVIKKELPVLIAVTAAMMLLAWMPQLLRDADLKVYAFGAADGIVMIAGFIFISWLWYRMARRDQTDSLTQEAEVEAELRSPGTLVRAVLMFVLGLVCLLLGGKVTEIGAVQIALKLGISDALVGLTIVAVATSLPELVTSIIACRKGHSDLAVGNVVGSNLFNILLVLGLTAIVSNVPVPVGRGWIDLFVMFGLTIVLLPIAMTGERRISRMEGVFLLTTYVIYIVLGITILK